MASTLEPDVKPSHPLSRGSDDPAGDWRRNDPEVLSRLAALELRDAGVGWPKEPAAMGAAG